MLHSVFVYLTVAAFAGAGMVNTVGKPAQTESFVRWGFPAWWCRVTGVLEIAVAILIAIPVSRPIGLTLGAIVMAGAALTVLRHREFSHLAPIGVYVILLVVTSVVS